VLVCGVLAAQPDINPTAQTTPARPRRNDGIGFTYSSIRSIGGSKFGCLIRELPSKTAHWILAGPAGVNEDLL